MDCRFYYKRQVIGLREGKYTAEVADILVNHLMLLVESGNLTYGYLETTADELKMLVAQAKSKVSGVNRV